MPSQCYKYQKTILQRSIFLQKRSLCQLYRLKRHNRNLVTARLYKEHNVCITLTLYCWTLFPGPKVLLKAVCLSIFGIFSTGPTFIFFFQNSQALCIFKAISLLFLPNFPGPKFIPYPMSIPETGL